MIAPLGEHDRRGLRRRRRVPHLIPPLLQTPEYAAAACQVSQYPPPPADVTEVSVKNLLRRRQVLNGNDGPGLWTVIEAPALLRPIAGVEAQVRQLNALINAVQAPKIGVQVNPMATSFLPACQPFTMFRFSDGKPQVIAIHDQPGDEIVERQRNEGYAMTFDRLTVAARRAGETAAILTTIRDQVHTVAADH
ncbi:DUF5753 domain-containing protein [Streptosporangium canum]|uniref:DUF5753 domain-containing protein n=1 Tax=Streptosporangium canum TaxID=324952 RepID=UPI003449B100